MDVSFNFSEIRMTFQGHDVAVLITPRPSTTRKEEEEKCPVVKTAETLSAQNLMDFMIFTEVDNVIG